MTSPYQRVESERKVERKTVNAMAPLRIDWSGGPTDVKSLYEQQPGTVTSGAIDYWALVTISALSTSTPQVSIVSHNFNQNVEFPLKALPELSLTNPLALIKAILQTRELPCGIKVVTHVDAPLGSGLGSSAALAVALLIALDKFIAQPEEGLSGVSQLLCSQELQNFASQAVQIENKALGNVGGFQDQFMAAFGGFYTFYADKKGIAAEPLMLSPATVKHLENNSLLIYTGSGHVSGDILNEVLHNSVNGDLETTSALQQLRESAQDIRDCLKFEALGEFPKLIRQAYECQRRLHPAVIPESIQATIEELISMGALAGKLLGAGGGGMIYLYCPAEIQPIIKQYIKPQYSYLPVRFTEKGASYEFVSPKASVTIC